MRIIALKRKVLKDKKEKGRNESQPVDNLKPQQLI